MTTEKTESTNGTEFYLTNFKRLQYATHIVRLDTGEEIKNFKEIAGIYGYMRDQYESYSKKGLEFFESLESIGLHFHGMDRRTVKKFIDVLNAIGLINSVKQKQTDYGYDRYHHTVIPLEKIADNLIFYGPEKISGGPLADGMLIRELEKKKPRGKPKTKKAAESTNEESNGEETNKKPATVAPETAAPAVEQTGSLPPVDAGGDANLSANDDALSATSKEQPQIAPLNDLLHWQNEGSDDEEFMAYGAEWGITKPGAIADLIKSHIRKIQSGGYRGSRSAANDEPSGADVHYKQRQEQAAAKRAVNAQTDEPPMDFNDDLPF
ncbi:DUF6945 domain-containing protein [Citrobacter sedlakii]|uniref:DUF6945 domain-containing protein n=1 Tax=Citrobacter sedlakii TaxID=67826 RepID=UPI0012866B71|nr:hypothetical protein [Salmonella enterica subsp. enterica serovar Senftenberg]EEN1179750.1 hypothetical protein [Salmonella enterica subsp. enterica serovar Senftenberg]